MRLRPAVSGFLVAGMLAAATAARSNAQSIDPAVVGERIQRLTAAVESLELSMASQKRQIDALGNEVHKMRDEMSRQGDALRQSSTQRPWADDLKRLADAISEVDRKRAADGEQVVKVLNDLKRAVAASTEIPKPSRAAPSEPRTGSSRGGGSGRSADTSGDKDKDKDKGDDKPTDKPPDKALEYVLERGQRLSDVVVSFNAEAKKQGYQTLSVAQVMKFNNIKDDKRIREGAKILLPVIPAR